jgi:hypothetical protein
MLLLRYSLLAIALPLLAQRSIPVENEFVRVVSVVDQPVTKPGAVHEHQQNRVMIYLDPADINIRFSTPSAEHKNEDQHWKAGDVAWSPSGGLHTSQHSSSAATRIVEIELKKPASTNPKPLAASAGKDILLDKPQVLVYRSATMPSGANYVAVDLKTAETTWNHAPAGSGPFVITLLK